MSDVIMIINTKQQVAKQTRSFLVVGNIWGKAPRIRTQVDNSAWPKGEIPVPIWNQISRANFRIIPSQRDISHLEITLLRPNISSKFLAYIGLF
jgi:hypothetical protein